MVANSASLRCWVSGVVYPGREATELAEPVCPCEGSGTEPWAGEVETGPVPNNRRVEVNSREGSLREEEYCQVPHMRYTWSGPDAERGERTTHGFIPLENALPHPRDQTLYSELPYELGG